MSRVPFATLIFRGKRFDGAAMPLEALPELAAYRDLVVAVAKQLFLEANPNRVRLPKGFDASFRLTLSRIEAGSAVPIIEREQDLLPLFPGDFFDNARAAVERAIAELPDNEPKPSWLTPDVVGRFASFGRTLRDDESVVVALAGKREGAVYDRHARRSILLRSQGTYEEEIELVGVVRETDADQESFEIRLGTDRRIPVRSSRLFFSQVVRSLERDSAVRVSGTGVFDAEGKLLRVAQASDVSAAEEGDVATGRPGCNIPVDEQIASLRGLSDGWCDGEGTRFEESALVWSAKLLRGIIDGFCLPTPYVYPTPEGKVRAEWSRPNWEISMDLEPAHKTAEVRAVRLDADEMHERDFTTADPGQEARLGAFLSSHLQGED
ncbi:MAG: hypothetical protein IPI67_12860 [Myxococcales bacterium]|nr:hypothetical protein [Myxococcales bacterium]